MESYNEVTLYAYSRKELNYEIGNYEASGYTLLSVRFYIQWPRVWNILYKAELDNLVPIAPALTYSDAIDPEVPYCLHEKLTKAIKDEDYEQAAKIRNEINKLTKK